MKKILFLCNGDRSGGISASLAALLNSLAKNEGLRIDLFLTVKDSPLLKRISERIGVVDIPELRRAITLPSGGFKKMLALIKRKCLLRTVYAKILDEKKSTSRFAAKHFMSARQKRTFFLLKNSNIRCDLSDVYDAVISFGELQTLYLVSAVIQCRKKAAWIHPNYLAANFDANFDRFALRSLDALVAVSEQNRKVLIPVFGEERSFSVGNLLEPSRIRLLADAETVAFQPNTFHIVTVARIQNISKGIDRALAIAKKIFDNGLSFCWHFVGDGEDLASMRELANSLGISDVVDFVGHKDNPYPFIKQATLFALPSFYEGKPIVVEEALVLSTPVLITDYAAAKEQIVNGKNGLIVENSEEAIFSSLCRLIQEPSLLDGFRRENSMLNSTRFTDSSDFYRLLSQLKI